MQIYKFISLKRYFTSLFVEFNTPVLYDVIIRVLKLVILLDFLFWKTFCFSEKDKTLIINCIDFGFGKLCKLLITFL